MPLPPLRRVARFGITRAHLEEDSGKTVYGGADRLAGSEYSLVDYNRAGALHSTRSTHGEMTTAQHGPGSEACARVSLGVNWDVEQRRLGRQEQSRRLHREMDAGVP